MFGLSFGELLIIAALALILLGPDRLPEAARTRGKVLREMRGATENLKDQLENEHRSAELESLPPAMTPVSQPQTAITAPEAALAPTPPVPPEQAAKEGSTSILASGPGTDEPPGGTQDT